MLQFWKISTNAAPLCAAAARSTSVRCARSVSIERATKVASAPIASDSGLNGQSSEPYGVDFVRDDKTNRIYLEHGKPIRFGEDGSKGVRQLTDGSLEIFEGDGEALVHDAEHATPSLAFGLSRLTQERVGTTPIGVFRAVQRPVYDELMAEQIENATAKLGAGDLEALLHAGGTWTVA
jgi:hypothetical protein